MRECVCVYSVQGSKLIAEASFLMLFTGHCADQDKCGPDGYLDQNCNCVCRDGSSDCDSTKKLTHGMDVD